MIILGQVVLCRFTIWMAGAWCEDNDIGEVGDVSFVTGSSCSFLFSIEFECSTCVGRPHGYLATETGCYVLARPAGGVLVLAVGKRVAFAT